MATAFQTKAFPAISAAMINHARGTQTRVTDFVVGSKIRTLLESAAVEIDEFYQQVLNGILAAIPVALYQSFDFQPLEAVSAGGPLALNVAQSNSALLIAAGTVFTLTATGASYVTTAAVTIAAGQTTGQVFVEASTAGAIGNAAAGQAFSAPVNGLISASNPAAFSGGQDEETPDQQKARFQAFVATLRGATDDALAYGAGQAAVYDANGNVLERVRSVYVVDGAPPAGQGAQPVSIYVHNGTGGTSAALVAAAQQIISGYVNSAGVKVPGYKVAGVPTTVYAATDAPLAIGGSLHAAPGYTSSVLAAAANTVVGNYVQGLAVGASFILAEAYALVMAIPGATNWNPAALTVSGAALSMADVAVQPTQKLTAGANGIIGA